MKEPENIVLVTIPDYSYSPAASDYETEGVSRSIEEYNDIIKSEGQKRGLPVADIYSVSQTMTDEQDYISDGLHPSAEGYAKWEEVIYPVVYEFLKE
jgi:lysophospholipase L1-like esterase